MRILIPASKDFLEDKNANPFISILYNGLRDRGFDVDCGLEEFWNRAMEYDVVFFQWPEAVFEWEQINAQLFQNYLDKLKDKGVKMVATCHNLHAHRYNKEADKLYDRLYASVDAIHHLGNYSYRLFRDKYPQCRHFVAQHPIFYDIVAQGLDQRLCRKRLRLPLRKQIILAFGDFRKEDEKQLFFSLRKEFSPSKVALVAPRLDHELGLYQGWHLERSSINLCKRISMRMNEMYCRRGVVDLEDVPAYFVAADVVFIQRLEILNSGNVPMAYAAAKVVVGPDMGNVGELLRATGNPAFDVHDHKDIIEKCKQALQMAQTTDIGRANYEYARQHMMPDQFLDIIATQLSELVR